MDESDSAVRQDRSQALPVGTGLKGLVVESVLGGSPFGNTYLTRNVELGKRFVLKEHLPAALCRRDPETLEVTPRGAGENRDKLFAWSVANFRKEAGAIAALNHPGIVRVLGGFEHFGTTYIAMPYVEGGSFAEQIRIRHADGPEFTSEELHGLLWHLLETLHFLHERGIYHEGIRPENILLSEAGVPALIGFNGARRRLCERIPQAMEKSGYTPIEQTTDAAAIGPQSDVFALGATLFAAITGNPPAVAKPIPLTRRLHLQARFPQTLLESIDKALEPMPGDRFQDAAEWRRALWGDPQEAEAERIEKERIEKERIEKERIEKERIERERIERERIERERIERERIEKERLEKERLEKERIEKERLEKERLEKERLEKERIEKERIEKERIEKERIEKERLEKERLEKERLEKERLEKERLEKERLEKERVEKERIEKARIEKERIEKERIEKERIEKERIEKERIEKERIEKERIEKERLEKERAAQIQAEQERVGKDQVAPPAIEPATPSRAFTFRQLAGALILIGIPVAGIFGYLSTREKPSTAPAPPLASLSPPDTGLIAPPPIPADVTPLFTPGPIPPGAESSVADTTVAPTIPPLDMTGKEAGEVRIFGGIEMIWCPPGTFTMGSPWNEKGRFMDETPHEVILTQGFWMAKTETTQKQWEVITAENPSWRKGENLPVEKVTWSDVQSWLEKKNEQDPPPSGWKWSLPTEAQWEYACRAGTTTPIYSGPLEIVGALNAPALDAIAWYGGNSSVGYTGPGMDTSSWKDKQYPGGLAGEREVGGKQPNAWGLHDMLGNVWEWCADWMGPYEIGTVTDPTGPAAGEERGMRGGSWGNGPDLCRAAARNGNPGEGGDGLGFRAVIVPPAKADQ